MPAGRAAPEAPAGGRIPPPISGRKAARISDRAQPPDQGENKTDGNQMGTTSAHAPVTDQGVGFLAPGSPGRPNNLVSASESGRRRRGRPSTAPADPFE